MCRRAPRCRGGRSRKKIHARRARFGVVAGCPAPSEKIFLIFRRRKSAVYLSPSRPPQRGGSRRHGRGAGCGGRGGALDGRCLQRTAKTCGPDTPTLGSSWGGDPGKGGGQT